MKKFSILMLSCLFLAGSTCVSAAIIQETDGGKLKAQLNKVQLAEIMHYVEDKYGVTFKGDASALQAPVTVSFDNLDLEGMLKRVLAKKNFFLVYNKHGEVIEVRMPGSSGTQFAGKSASLPNYMHGSAVGEFPADIFRANGTTALGLYPNAYAFNASGETNKKNREPDEITKFKVDPKAQNDPITSFRVDPKAQNDEITRFKVNPNKPEKDPAFKVIPNAVPPSQPNKDKI